MPRAPASLFTGISTTPQLELEPEPGFPAAASAAAAEAAVTVPTDSITYEADLHPSRDASSSGGHRPLTAGPQIAIDCCSLKDLASLNHEQLLQLCQAQAVEIKSLKADMQWLAASRDASIVSSKEEAACQATVIAQLQDDNASLRTTNTSQAATMGCLKKQASDLQQQLGSAQCGAGKWRASYALLKTQAESKYSALARESEAIIDKWAAHGKELQQQAEKAAAEYAALHTRCAELTSQLSSFQAAQSDHKCLLTSSQQVVAEYNLLRERLDSWDALMIQQRLQLQQLRGATDNATAASSGHGTALAVADFTPAAAAAAQKIHGRNERSGYRRRHATPRTLTQSRLSACSSATTASVEPSTPARRFNTTNG
jgi:myosin heavy subunit